MKKDLREKYINIRKNIRNKEIKDNIIFNKVINNKFIKQCSLILIYVSCHNEVDTIELIKYFLNHKKQLAVPKIENDIMKFYYIKDLSDLSLGYFNILEPMTKEKVINFSNCVSITPGICFSKDNYRIGYGKGFYDKFYQKHNIYKIGLCYKECMLDNIPSDIHDISLDEVITD